MVLRSERLSLRSWTFHDDELADDWPSYNDPLEPLWNLPRQVGLAGLRDEAPHRDHAREQAHGVADVISEHGQWLREV